MSREVWGGDPCPRCGFTLDYEEYLTEDDEGQVIDESHEVFCEKCGWRGDGLPAQVPDAEKPA